MLIHLSIFCTKPTVILRYIKRTKKLPIFITPKTINEKFLWRKFFDHNPLFTEVSDKLACKKYSARKVPYLKVAQVLKIIETPEDIYSLSDKFLALDWVLKSTHGSGDVLVKSNGYIEKNILVNKVRKMLENFHGKVHHEWGYFNINRKVFFEELIGKGKSLQEFKVYTFGQQIGRVVQIGGRFEQLWSQAWDYLPNGQLVVSEEKALLAPSRLNKHLPDNVDEIIRIAKIFGSDFDHMRVDLLTDGVDIYLGELTVYNCAGYHSGPSGNDPNGSMTKLWDIKKAYCFGDKNDQKKSFFNKCYTNLIKKHL